MKIKFKNALSDFGKGVAVGLGGVAPGLSGSVLLVLFGLYEKTINAISTIFKNFRKNVAFLFPLALGMGVGVLLFSKLVQFLLDTYPMQTRFAFLGFILGSLPLFYSEVKKKGFSEKYYAVIALSLALGMIVFGFNKSLFSEVTNPNVLQKLILGFTVATSYLIPGVDSAAILSSLGLYELWVNAVADLDFSILIYAAIGLAVGVLVVSFIINYLIKKFYTLTFSAIFGFFISVIPGVINDECKPALNVQTVISVVLTVVCFFISLAFSKLPKLIKGRNR